APTVLLLDISDLIQNEYYKPMIMIALLILIFKVIVYFPKGREMVDLGKMFTPIFGQIVRKSAISRFCRTLGTLLDSGVPLVEGLNILKGAAGNFALSALIEKITDAVKQGESMVMPLRSSKIFDEMTISMLEVGDEAGEVSQMMVKVADNFDNEVDAQVAAMKSLIEPFLIVGLGGAVGFIVVALFLPLIAIMQNLGG
ncbi:MAG: type II secretion system F family protein, partial [Planctomycetes bacterium]|nr:type II secretion system F family protein [Planctomycetota bacterium]